MKKLAKVMVFILMITMLFSQYVMPSVLVSATTPALVYDGLNYSPGPILTLNGGFGWGGKFESSVYYGGGKQSACITDNVAPLGYFDGSNYLMTEGRDVSFTTAYVGAQRPLDLTTAGPLKDYIFYTPQPIPAGTPYPAANTYQVGKQGTKLWGSFLQYFGQPGGWDTETRALVLHNSTATNQYYQTFFYKVSFGYFGAASRLAGAGVGYQTVRIYSPVNPGSYLTSNTTDTYYYDASNKFLYVRIKTAPLTLLYASHFIAYSIEYSSTDTIINTYIDPVLGATEPLTPSNSISIPLNANNLYIRGIGLSGSGNLAKAFFDEFRIGANYDSIAPVSSTLPQPTSAPATLGTKIVNYGTPTVEGTNATGAQYLIDGITTDNAKLAGASNINRNGVYTLPLTSYKSIGAIKVYAGEAGATLLNNMPCAYYLSYWTGLTWDMIPETSVWGNRETIKTFVLPKPVYTNKIRLNNITGASPKFAEVELYEPSTPSTFTQNLYSNGIEIMTDDFNSIDYSKWSIVGATPSSLGDAIPTPYSYPTPNVTAAPTPTANATGLPSPTPNVTAAPTPTLLPTPQPNYRPYIISDSSASPLPWMQVSNATPIPTTSSTWRSDFYADGNVLVLTPTTNYYAFRSKATIPKNFAFEATFKTGRSGNNPIILLFNESGTISDGTGTNGYRLELLSDEGTNNFAVTFQKVVNGTIYFLSSSMTCNRGYYYLTVRVQVNEGNIKIWQNAPETGWLQLIDINDSTFTSGNILLQRQQTAWPVNVMIDSLKIYNVTTTPTEYVYSTPSPTPTPTPGWMTPPPTPSPTPTPLPTASPTPPPTPAPTPTPTPWASALPNTSFVNGKTGWTDPGNIGTPISSGMLDGYAMRFDLNKPWNSFSAPMYLEANTDYIIKYFTRCPSTTAIQVQIATSGVTKYFYSAVSTDWTQNIIYYTTNAAGNYTFNFTVGNATATTCDVDDVTFTKAADAPPYTITNALGTNIMPNPGFETVNASAVPIPWGNFPGTGLGVNGGSGLRVNSGNGYTQRNVGSLVPYVGKYMNITYKIRPITMDPSGTVIRSNFGATGLSYIYDIQAMQLKLNTWTTFSQTFLIPAGVADGIWYFNASGINDMVVDDISFAEVVGPQYIYGPNSTPSPTPVPTPSPTPTPTPVPTATPTPTPTPSLFTLTLNSSTAADTSTTGDTLYDAYLNSAGTTTVNVKASFLNPEILYSTTVVPLTKTASISSIIEGTYVVSVSRNGYMTRYITVSGTVGTVDIGYKYLIPGDVFADGIIDGSDTELMFTYIGNSYGDPLFDSKLDFNNDGIVDGTDSEVLLSFIGSTSGNYGETVIYTT